MRSSLVAASIGGAAGTGDGTGAVKAPAAASAVRSAPPAAIAPAAMPVFFRKSRRSDIKEVGGGNDEASHQTTTRKDVGANHFRGGGASRSLLGVSARGA